MGQTGGDGGHQTRARTKSGFARPVMFLGRSPGKRIGRGDESNLRNVRRGRLEASDAHQFENAARVWTQRAGPCLEKDARAGDQDSFGAHPATEACVCIVDRDPGSRAASRKMKGSGEAGESTTEDGDGLWRHVIRE